MEHNESKESPKDDISKEETSEGVVVPEEFQTRTHELLKDATKEQLAHVRDRVYAREDELRKAEEAKKSKNGKVKEFSTAEMPSPR